MQIIVIDSGFVYIGTLKRVNHDILGDAVLIKEAKNIRIWGTKKGLGELANMGKTPRTELDYVGTVTVPFAKVLHLIDVQPQVQNSFK